MKRNIAIIVFILVGFFAKSQTYHDSTSYDSIRVKNDIMYKYETVFRNIKGSKSQNVIRIVSLYRKEKELIDTTRTKWVFIRPDTLKMSIRR